MGPDTFAFVTALLVNFVDMMGTQFTMPVTVPYGRVMGASLQTIALSATLRGVMAMVSNIWMPRLSDSRGRKLVIMLSLVGSAVAYIVQGLAGEFVGASVGIFLFGRALSGFFGGTMPVVRAYVTELSMPDLTLMKQRMTLMITASQASGVALSPIAGALATFGLSLPYYVCGAVGVLGIVWAVCFFKEASQLKGEQSSHGKQETGDTAIQGAPSVQDPAASESQELTKPERKNPWCDKVTLMMFFGYVSIFVIVSAFSILIPEMLEDASFGLVGKDREETSKNISKAMGLVSVPNGLCNVFVSLVLFMPVTRVLGDVPTIVVSGIIMSFNIAAYGLWPTNLWQLCVLQAITGLCIGFMLPALGPLIARYAHAHYPQQIAECQGIPVLGMNLSLAFGQNLLELVHAKCGMAAAWILCGACACMFMILFVCSFWLVDSREPKPEKLSAEQKKVMLQTGGADADAFIDTACEELRAVLVEHRETLWNGPIQFLVKQRLHNVVPQVREWHDESQGQEYMHDLASLLLPFPEEFQDFQSKFPQVCRWHLDRLDVPDVDLEVGFSPPSHRSRSASTSQVYASPVADSHHRTVATL